MVLQMLCPAVRGWATALQVGRVRVRQAQLQEEGRATGCRVGIVEEQYAKVRAKMRVMRVRPRLAA